VAIAPAFTIGFIVRSAFNSTAITELKGSPVLFTPILRRASSQPTAWDTRANTKGLETLWIENSFAVSPTAKTRPLMPTTHTPKSSRGVRASAGM